MAYIFNGVSKKITLTAGTTEVNLSDAYSRWKDWVAVGGNSRFAQAFRFEGSLPDGLGGFTGLYIFLMNGWAIEPQSANHTLAIVGNLLRDPDDSSGRPLVLPVPGYTVSVIINRSSLAQGISVGGSSGGGLTSQQAAQLSNVETRSARVDALIESSGDGDRFTTKALEAVPLAESITDWTSTERSQIRKRLGIDGETDTPSTTPDLSTLSLENIEGSEVLAKQSTLLLIPSNPLLTNDPRLNNLDVTISSRATPADLQVVVSGGFTVSDRLELQSKLNAVDYLEPLGLLSSKLEDTRELLGFVPGQPLTATPSQHSTPSGKRVLISVDEASGTTVLTRDDV